MIEGSLPQVYDAATLRFAQFVSETDWRRLARQYADEVARRAAQGIDPPNKILEAEFAANYLKRLIDRVTEEILERHKAYGSVRWLWYLRRLPGEVFAGNYTTTLGYDRALAESLSWYFTGKDTSIDSALIAFPSDVAAFRHAVRLVAGVKLLSHVHAMYRRAGKGAKIDATKYIPFDVTDNLLAEPIHIYDVRHDRNNELCLGGLGLATAEADSESLEKGAESKTVSIFLSIPCEPIRVPVRGPDGKGGFSLTSVPARHALKAIKLEILVRPFQSKSAEVPSYLQIIEPLLFLLALFPVIANRIPWALSSTIQFGYFFVRDNVLASIVDNCIPYIGKLLKELAPDINWSQNYAEWRKRISAIEPGLWPLQCGGVLRNQGDGTLVDITAASSSLLHHLELDRSAFVSANDRGLAFELQVQKIVDNSPWRPNETVGMLRGRTLRRDGNTITDVDAIGAKGDTLLLISCKSVIYDREYDRGAYRVIRNVQGTIDSAVQAWQQIIANVRTSPTGGNFDFSGFARIVDIVCTPFVVYSSNPHTLSFAVNDLRSCSSAIELRDWLAREH